jgi:hypothetical protein
VISPAASIAAPLINNPVLSLTGTFVPHARRRGSFTSLKSLLAADALQSNPGESTCNDVAWSILGEHFNRRRRKFARFLRIIRSQRFFHQDIRLKVQFHFFRRLPLLEFIPFSVFH